jgi:hypothetical protein
MPGEALREYLAPEGVSVSSIPVISKRRKQPAILAHCRCKYCQTVRRRSFVRALIVADLSSASRFDCSCKAEYGKSEQLVCIFVLCWRALSFNRSRHKSSTRARTSAFFDRPRRFELRQPPHARKMHGRFGMTMQCEPRPICGLRLDRLEESCFVAF